MVNILELMNKRHSVRKYIDEEIDSSVTVSYTHLTLPTILLV